MFVVFENLCVEAGNDSLQDGRVDGVGEGESGRNCRDQNFKN